MSTKRKSLKKLLLSSLFALLLAVSGYGQSVDDEQVVTFQFRAKGDMFSVSVGDNRSELQRLFNLLEQYRSEIERGEIPVYINGYCTSMSSEDENLSIARIRSNRVKTQLIVAQKLKELHFITYNQAIAYQGNGDIVTVTLRIPQKEEVVAYLESAPEKAKETQTVQAEEVAQSQVRESAPQAIDEPQAQETFSTFQPQRSTQKFAVRTNLLHWAVLLPNLGIEYQPNETIGILLNGGWSRWTSETSAKQHRVWYITPEARYYLGEAKHWYLGVEAHAGSFNLKVGDTGRQADFAGGGITGGYKLHLNRSLDLDFNLGLGYARLMDFDKYTRTNCVYVRTQPMENKNYWGLTQAGVSLVWKIKN